MFVRMCAPFYVLFVLPLLLRCQRAKPKSKEKGQWQPTDLRIMIKNAVIGGTVVPPMECQSKYV